MIIKEIYISAFGKLNDFGMTFDSGLNTIVRPNGFGKTTLCEFIRAMFYGLPSSRSQKVEDARRRYEPWSGGNYGGYLVFEDGERDIRIERRFGKTQSGDKCSVTDNKTGKEIVYSPTVGEAVFGVDRDTFLKCLMLPQEFVMPEATKSISEKMSMSFAESENVRCEDAIKKLDDWRAKLYKTGKRGYIDELKAKRNLLYEKRINTESSLSRLDELCEEEELLRKREAEAEDEIKKVVRYKKLYECICSVKELNQRLQAVEQVEQSDCLRKIDFCENEIKKYVRQRDFYKESVDIENYRKSLLPLLSERDGKQERFIETRQELSQGEFCFKTAPDSELLKDIDVKTQEIDRCEKRCDELKNDIARIRAEKEAVHKPSLNVKNTVLFAILLVVGLIAVAVGAITYFGKTLNGAVPFIVMGGGAVLTIVFLSLLTSQLKKYSTEKRISDIAIGEIEQKISLTENLLSVESSAIADIKHNLTQRINAIGIDGEFDSSIEGKIATDLVKYRYLVNNADMARLDYESFMNKHADELKEAEKYNEQSLLSLTEGYERIVEKIDELKTERVKLETVLAQQKEVKTRDKQELKGQIDEKNKELTLLSEGIPEKWIGLDPERLEEESRYRLKELQAELYNKRADVEHLRNNTDDLQQIEGELGDLDTLIERYSRKLSNTYKAMEYLQAAESRLAESYIPKMRELLKAYLDDSKLFECIGEGESATCSFTLDKDFKLSVQEKGAMRPLSSFSKGTEALTAFYMRLSIMESMYGKKLPLLLLDDCFNDLDDDNYAAVMIKLKELSESVQVIYFSCHRG